MSNEINWERIENLVGFGRAEAPVVFVGLEEGLRDVNELEHDLAIRSQYDRPVMDLRVAHQGMVGADKYFDPERTPAQPTWRVMADLMLRREGTLFPTTVQRRLYRTKQLGRTDGNTILTELFPYPHPKRSDWLYERFGRFATRADYERTLLPKRKALLRAFFASTPRDLIVCYGKEAWPAFIELFDDVRWNDSKPFMIGSMGSTRIVLTTHFSSKHFNSDIQLESFAAAALTV